MIETTTVFGVLYALICGWLALVHSTSIGRVTLLDWALLAMGGMYGVGWVLVLYVTQAGGNPVWERWILPYESLYLVHSLGSLLLLLGVLVGWYMLASVLRNRPIRGGVVTRFQLRRWSRAFWLLLVLAVLAQGLYAHAHGGFLNHLEYSALIRSGVFGAVPDNPFSFLKPFGGLAMIAAFGFFGLWLSEQRNLSIRLGIVFSFGFSLYVLYSWLGRMGFLVFLITFPLAIILARSRSPQRMIIWAGAGFMGLLVGSYGVSLWLNLKPADSLLAFLARELSFPFGSFFAQIDSGEHLFRGFVDFLIAPVFLLPSSWWTNWLEPVNQINTAIIMGAPKGEAGVTGGIPVDLLTLGVMQLHLPGVLVTGLLFGALLRIVHNILSLIPLRGVRAVFEANIALTLAVLCVFYSQPNLVISSHIHWIAAVLILLVIVRLPMIRVLPAATRAGRDAVS